MSYPQQEEQSFSFRLKEVNEFDFFINNAIDELANNEYDPDLLNFSFNFSFRYDTDQDEFGILTSVSYLYGEEKNEYLKANIEVIYEIHQLKDKLNEEEEYFALPEKFLASLLGIAFSTVRGMIISRSKGTIWERKYLPIINPTQILRDEMEKNTE